MSSYLILDIKCYSIRKFLLRCKSNNIKIYSIRYISPNEVRILIHVSDYNRVKKYNYMYELKTIKKMGLNGLLEAISIYKIFIISIILGLILLFILCNTIFSIDIISDNTLLNKKIYKELEDYNIKKYKFVKSYKEIESIKSNIKSKYKDEIEWIEITRIGTKYVVNIVERKINKSIINNKVYDIVSKKSSIVRGIYVEKGISLVEKGNYVKKGDILVSSKIMLNEDIKDIVSVKGKVYGETWYKVNVEYPLNYSEKKYTNNYRYTPYIRINNKYIEFFKYGDFDRYKKVFYKDRLNIFEFGIETIREVKVINDKYSEEEALKKAEQEGIKKVNEMLDDDEYIIYKNTLNFYNNGSKIIVDIFFSVYENIGEIKETEVE